MQKDTFECTEKWSLYSELFIHYSWHDKKNSCHLQKYFITWDMNLGVLDKVQIMILFYENMETPRFETQTIEKNSSKERSYSCWLLGCINDFYSS